MVNWSDADNNINSLVNGLAQRAQEQQAMRMKLAYALQIQKAKELAAIEQRRAQGEMLMKAREAQAKLDPFYEFNKAVAAKRLASLNAGGYDEPSPYQQKQGLLQTQFDNAMKLQNARQGADAQARAQQAQAVADARIRQIQAQAQSDPFYDFNKTIAAQRMAGLSGRSQPIDVQGVGVSERPQIAPASPSGNAPPSMFMVNPNYNGKNDYYIKSPGYESSLKKQEEYDKPLAADSANKYSGALQTIRDLKEISNILGLNDPVKANSQKTRDLIYNANLAIEAANAKPNFVPGGYGVYKSWKMVRAGDEGSKLGNYFMTMAENILRLRTGAAAPDPEVVREYARSLLKSRLESPETWKSKLSQIEELATGVASNIRPNRWQQDLVNHKSQIFDDSSTKNKVIPKYNPKTEKLQQNSRTGEYRVVPR